MISQVRWTPLQPLTQAEASDYRETSRHADVMTFTRELAQKTDRIKAEIFGTSTEGREMPLLILSNDRLFTPDQAKASGLPVVLIINNIHAGEVEGKEASLALARETILGGLGHLLDKMILLIVPNFNPDGNDRISAENRKLDLENLEGQMGPDGGVGTRYTAKGINLNRDYIKQEAVEMRALTRVYTQWKPHLTIDCHTTDGSVHGFHLTYDTPHNPASGHPQPIEYVRTRLLPTVTQALRQRAGYQTFFYGNYVNDDPTQGWQTYSHLPRYGSHYRGLTNRMDILSEVYSYLPFKDRVFVNREFLFEVLNYVAEHDREIVAIVDAADQDTLAGRPAQVALEYRLEAEAEPVTILVPANAYPNESTARRRELQLQGPFVPLKTRHEARFVPMRTVKRPFAYVFSDQHPHIVEKLRDHGIRIERLKRPLCCRTEGYTLREVTSKPAADTQVGERLEYRARANPFTQERTLEAGTFVVRTAQPPGNLVVHMMEPESDDGLLTWGFFSEDLSQGREYPVLRIVEPVELPTE